MCGNQRQMHSASFLTIIYAHCAAVHKPSDLTCEKFFDRLCTANSLHHRQISIHARFTLVVRTRDHPMELCTNYTGAMSVLTNAGTDCDRCGGLIKVTVQRKKKSTKVLLHKREFGLKIKIIFIILITFNQGTKYTW